MIAPAKWWPEATIRLVSYAHEAGDLAARPLGWILHVVVGDASPWATFERAKSPRRRFSHLWVAKDGSAEAYAPLTAKSWAQSAGNASYWSVETEGYPSEPLTAAQVETLARWHVWSGTPDLLASAPGMPGIGTHYMGGAAWGGHSCPDPQGREGRGPRSVQRLDIIHRAQQIREGIDMISSEDVAAIAAASAKATVEALLAQWLGRSGPAVGTAVQSTAHGVEQLLARGPVALTDDQVAQLGPAVVAALAAQLAKP